MSRDHFTKETIRERHKDKIEEILSQNKGRDAIEALTNYMMRRIGNVIASERIKANKRELRLMSEGRQKHERKKRPSEVNKGRLFS